MVDGLVEGTWRLLYAGGQDSNPLSPIVTATSRFYTYTPSHPLFWLSLVSAVCDPSIRLPVYPSIRQIRTRCLFVSVCLSLPVRFWWSGSAQHRHSLACSTPLLTRFPWLQIYSRLDRFWTRCRHGYIRQALGLVRLSGRERTRRESFFSHCSGCDTSAGFP